MTDEPKWAAVERLTAQCHALAADLAERDATIARLTAERDFERAMLLSLNTRWNALSAQVETLRAIGEAVVASAHRSRTNPAEWKFQLVETDYIFALRDALAAVPAFGEKPLGSLGTPTDWDIDFSGDHQ